MDELKQKLNLETAQLPWSELARFFAGGKLIRVAPDMDLLEVAAAVAEDHSSRVRSWMEADRLSPVSDAEARHWQQAEAQLWAVVIKPWVLVQDRRTTAS